MPTTTRAARSSQRFRQTKRFKQAARTLGLQIRELRQARQWTLDRASQETEVDLKHLQKLEGGKLNVTLVTLIRIADGFEVPVETLFRLTPAKKRRKGAAGSE